MVRIASLLSLGITVRMIGGLQAVRIYPLVMIALY